MNKNEERREKFRLIGKAISEQAWKDRLGDHQFEIRGRAIQDPLVSSRMYGPQMKAQQWERSSRVTK